MQVQTSTRALVPCLAAVAVAAVAAGCAEESAAPVVQEAMADVDHIVMEQMETVITLEGVRNGVVISDSSYVYEDSSTAQLFGVQMTQYNEQGLETARLTSERGWLNERTDELTAVGTVVLIIPADGRRIETPELHYDPVRAEISSDSSTIQVLGGARTRATCGFRADLDFANFDLCGPVGDIPSRPGGG